MKENPKWKWYIYNNVREEDLPERTTTSASNTLMPWKMKNQGETDGATEENEKPI